MSMRSLISDAMRYPRAHLSPRLNDLDWFFSLPWRASVNTFATKLFPALGNETVRTHFANLQKLKSVTAFATTALGVLSFKSAGE